MDVGDGAKICRKSNRKSITTRYERGMQVLAYRSRNFIASGGDYDEKVVFCS
jgi:hypothetical protein